MKKLLFMLFFCCLTVQMYAQQNSPSGGRVIKGKVTDEKGDPLPGVTVTLKETVRRVSTNANGVFTLNLDGTTSTTAVFSFIGYETQEINFNGKTEIEVKLQITSKAMDEVVITALNISRKKASLGYSEQGVNVNEMTEARAQNVTDLLDGKVSGLQLTTSGTATGSTKIQLRGPGSISNNNQPLWVVDGVPIDNNDSNGAVSNSAGTLDYGNNAQDLNPDDIESIVVLKGPNAAALYGSKAANGAILVTTKKGKKNSGFGVSYNGNYMVSRVLEFPNLQFEYGEGSNGNYNGTLVGTPGSGVIQAGTGGGRDWGGLLLGQPYLNLQGKVSTYSPQPGVVNNLFQTGGTSTQNIAFSNADDHNAIRFSYTRTDGTDVIRNENVLTRNNFSMTESHDFAPWVKIESRVQYMQATVGNRTNRNEDPTNPFNYFNNAVLSIPLSSLIPWKNPATGNALGVGNNQGTGVENPYWDINENANQDTNNSLIGGVTATFKIFKKLQFRLQQSADLNWGNRYVFIQKGSLNTPNGYYSEFQQNNQVWNSEGLFTYNDHFGDFSLTANLGGNLRNTSYYNTFASTSQLAVQSVHALSNTLSIINATETPVKSQVQSLYATADLGYKDFLFLDLTDRNDWSSTLPLISSSFNYPSASGSFVFTELWKDIPHDILSFGKIRASIAQVGNDPSPYQVLNAFGSTGQAYNGISLLSYDQLKKNPNLKPEITTSTEFGTELHFLNERLSLDATVYSSKTKNQFLTGNIPQATGFTQEIINAGEIDNKGLELTLSGTPIKTENFTWNATWNFSMNRNKVVALLPGLNSINLGGTGVAQSFVQVGKPVGMLSGQDAMKSSDGKTLINPASGVPYYNNAPYPYIGNVLPKALTSFGSTFTYKNFSLNFLVNAHIGGLLYSATAFREYVSGNSATTLGGRDAWAFSQGVLNESSNEQKGVTTIYNLPYPTNGRVQGSLFQGYYPELGSNGQPLLDKNGNMIADLSKPNNYYISPQTYWQQTSHLTSFFTFDDSFVKLSQLIIGYNVPQRLLRKTIFKTGSVSLVGRNLWIIYQKTPKGIDPESAAFTGASGTQGNALGIEWGNPLPYATYGVDLKLSL